MNSKEPRHFSKEWFWDEGVKPILKSILDILFDILYLIFVSFVILPIKVIKFLYCHGMEIFKITFWLFAWSFMLIWVFSKYVAINDNFVINIYGIEIYAAIYILFLYLFIKYVRWELRGYNKNIVDNKLRVFDFAASSLYEENEYDLLVEYCENHIQNHSKNPIILYWLAKGKYKQGKLEDALNLFEEIKTIEVGENISDYSFEVDEIKQAIIKRDEEIIYKNIKRDNADRGNFRYM